MEKCDKTYNSICRVCLKQSKIESMVSLKEKQDRRSLLTFGKVLVEFARITIDYDDILPTKVCQNCKLMIQNISSFNLMCKNNDRKLREFVNLAQNDREKYKEMICEYTMFCQYFPGDGFKTTHGSPSASARGSFQEKIRKSKSPMQDISPINLISDFVQESMNYYGNDNDYYSDSILDDNENESCTDSENVDLFLDSIEKAIDTEIFNKSVKAQQTHSSIKTHSSFIQSSSNIKNIDSYIDSIEKAVNTRIKYNTKCNIKTKVKVKSKVPKSNFHCDKCNRTLANRYTYNYHMQRHTEYLYICDQCGKGFPGNEPLNRHLVKNHDKGPSLQCDHCPFKCSRRFDLVEHIRIHTGERPFTCDKCGLTFRRKAIWRNHSIQHKEKSILCNICQKKFHRQSELSAHLNSIHERMFLYLCSICDMSFAKNGTVRKHMLTKHGIPRDKQGKITRVSKETNSLLFMEK